MGLSAYILSCIAIVQATATATAAAAAKPLSPPKPVAPAKSSKVVYPPQKISGQGIENIEITGVRGWLRLSGSKYKGYRLRVAHTKNRKTADDWNLLVERRGHTLFLEVASSAYGKEWKRLLRRQQYPEFDIALDGPPLPAKVSWQDGSLHYVGWTAPMETAFTNGDVKITDGGGGAHQILNTGNARVLVNHFDGELEINGERGQVDLFDIDGVLTLNWLRGPLTLTDVCARTKIETSDGEIHIAGGNGEWEAQALGGAIHLNEFGGHFKGRGGSTRWTVRGKVKSEIELVSNSGPVQVDWKSTAKVFLTSNKGSISSPYDIQDRDGQRVAEGRRGNNPLAQVFVRTETGDITFKY